MSRGPGTKQSQIAKLSEAVGEEGVAQAQSIVDTHTRDVVALAFKLLPAKSSSGLGKKIEDLLNKVRETSGEEAAQNILATLEVANNLDEKIAHKD